MTQLEALTVFWSVKRLYKFIFNNPFILNTDYEALKYIFGRNKSSNKNSASIVKRWSIKLSASDYKIEHLKESHILRLIIKIFAHGECCKLELNLSRIAGPQKH